MQKGISPPLIPEIEFARATYSTPVIFFFFSMGPDIIIHAPHLQNMMHEGPGEWYRSQYKRFFLSVGLVPSDPVQSTLPYPSHDVTLSLHFHRRRPHLHPLHHPYLRRSHRYRL